MIAKDNFGIALKVYNRQMKSLKVACLCLPVSNFKELELCVNFDH